MKAFRLLLPVFLLAASNVHAQWQVGIAGGVAQYYGDLSDRTFVSQLIRPSFGVHAKYELKPRIVLRGALNFAQVAGADRYRKNESDRLRNLSFASNITEFSTVAEVHAFGMDEARFSPYAFGGLALYHFNPYTFDALGQKVFLQPLGTEGQGIDGYPQRSLYSRTSFALPFGGGLRFNVTDNIILGAEIGFRKLFTDYLDDVSTNFADENDLLLNRGPVAVSLAYRADELPDGNPTFPAKGSQRGGADEKDMYFMGQLQLSIRLGQGSILGGGNRGSKGSRRSALGCPTNPM